MIAPDERWRFMRIPFTDKAISYARDGKAASAKRRGIRRCWLLSQFPYPNTWNNSLADQVQTVRVLPIGSEETEVQTTWLVRKDAVEGLDCDLKQLAEVWIAINDEDRQIVEGNQQGINSPSCIPGPYSKIQEGGVNQFVPDAA